MKTTIICLLMVLLNPLTYAMDVDDNRSTETIEQVIICPGNGEPCQNTTVIVP